MLCPLKFNIYTLDINGKVADADGCRCEGIDCAWYGRDTKTCSTILRDIKIQSDGPGVVRQPRKLRISQDTKPTTHPRAK